MRTQVDGETVRRLREELGLTLKDLADRSGISYPYLCRLENEERHGRLAKRQDLARALGVTLAQISKPVPTSPAAQKAAA